jgi:lysozyme
MTPSDKCVEMIARFEGFRAEAYKDIGGVWTIGYGFTEGVKKGDTITRDAADARLLIELQKFADGVLAMCSARATQPQLDAMTSLAYNIGLGAFYKSSVLRMHNIGATQAAGRAFSLWNKVDGRVVAGLSARRAKESALYLTDSVL